MSQMNDDNDDYVFQQDGRPAHFHNDLRDCVKKNLPQRWIRRFGQEDVALIRWPPKSPDLTPCDIFLWGFVKYTDFVPPVPLIFRNLTTVSPQLRQ